MPQKAFLFSGTILSNLLMGNAKATTEEIRTALEISQSSEFIDSLPQGIESFVAKAGPTILVVKTKNVYCTSLNQTGRRLYFR